MKRSGDIASLFWKHAAKKAAADLNPSPIEPVVEKERMQRLRSNGWAQFLKMVTFL